MKSAFVTIAVWLLQVHAVQAASFGSPGTAGADFLKIPSAARPAAMAGAAVASGEGLEAIEYNPARLSTVLGWELSAQHLSYAEGIALEQLSLGWGRKKLGTALSILSLNTPDIPSTDISGAINGSFKQQDLAVSAGAGYEMGAFSFGIVSRVIQRSLAGYSYNGLDADLGVAWQPWGAWRVGLVAQHLGSLGALAQEADPAPMTFREGLSWSKDSSDGVSIRGELDSVQPRDSTVQARLGLELGWSLFFARAGTQVSQAYEGRQPFTVGAGFRYSSWQLDYSFAELQGLGTTHRIGLNWRLDGAYGGRKGLEAPSQLAVTKNGNDLMLTWTGPAKAAGYAIYLRKGIDVDMKRSGQTGAGQTRLRLKRAATLPLLGLAVSSLTEDGQESPLSTELRVKSGDEGTSEVVLPTGLRVEMEEGQRVLHWDVATQAADLSYQVLVSRRSGSGYAPLGRPTYQKQKTLPPVKEWKEARFLVVQVLRQGKEGQEASVLSKQLDLLPR